MTFASVYEILTPLTTVKKQWFVEWFDGDALKSYWTTVDVLGSSTFAMDDTIDGGFTITTPASGSNRARIGFNNIRHYSNTASIIIAMFKSNTTANGQIAYVGLRNAIADNDTQQQVNANFDGNQTNIQFESGDASTATQDDTGVARHTNFTTVKIEMLSASAKLTLDGTVTNTKTTNLPTVRLQPQMESRIFSGTTATVGSLRYLEAFNT